MIEQFLRSIKNPDSPLWGPILIYGEWAYTIDCVIEFLGSNWFLIPVVGLFTCFLYRKHSRRELLQALVVSYYILAVVKITSLYITSTFFPGNPNFVDPDPLLRYDEDMTRISLGFHMSLFNLKLFHSIAGTFRHSILYGLVQTLGNIILFIPCGTFVHQFSRKRNVLRSVFRCFLISLLIETCQLFLPSSFDVDDLLMNTIGGMIGILALEIPLLKRRIVQFQHRIEAKIKWLN